MRLYDDETKTLTFSVFTGENIFGNCPASSIGDVLGIRRIDCRFYNGYRLLELLGSVIIGDETEMRTYRVERVINDDFDMTDEWVMNRKKELIELRNRADPHRHFALGNKPENFCEFMKAAQFSSLEKDIFEYAELLKNGTYNDYHLTEIRIGEENCYGGC